MNKMYNAMGAALLGATMLAGPVQADRLDNEVVKLSANIQRNSGYDSNYPKVGSDPDPSDYQYACWFHANLASKGVKITLNKRELSNNIDGKMFEMGGDAIKNRWGSNEIPASGSLLIYNRWVGFKSGYPSLIFTETWSGKDSDGNLVKAQYDIKCP